MTGAFINLLYSSFFLLSLEDISIIFFDLPIKLLDKRSVDDEMMKGCLPGSIIRGWKISYGLHKFIRTLSWQGHQLSGKTTSSSFHLQLSYSFTNNFCSNFKFSLSMSWRGRQLSGKTTSSSFPLQLSGHSLWVNIFLLPYPAPEMPVMP